MNIWEEGLKCSQDFAYFCKKYVKHISQGPKPMAYHPFHQKMIDLYEKERWVCVKKFRGSALSTFTHIYGLWRCLFHHDQNVFVLCKNYADAKHRCKNLTDMINLLPEWMQALMSKNTAHVKTFVTNSVMMFYTWEACRARQITHLIIDEADWNNKLNEEWKNIYICLGTTGKCFAVSSPHKIGNWFYCTFNEALNKQNSFVPYEPSYLEHPDYQNKEYCERIEKSLGSLGWNQEILGYWCGS